MDIVQIGVSKGQTKNFMDLVDPSMKHKCERYVEKSGGPTEVYRAEDGRTPIQFVEDAFKPLEKYKSKIAIVIDGSTTRGFTEPSQASLYAQHLNIRKPRCFDVSEACNGWFRAVYSAYMLFQQEEELEDKYILVINNEQPPETRAILPKDDKDYKSVASYYVGLTFSNVCTCTILKKSNNYTWNFFQHTNPEYASHISIGLPGLAKGYLPHTDAYEVDLNEQYGQFCIPRLHQVEQKAEFVLGTVERIPEFFKKANCICHTFSRSVYEKVLGHSDLGALSLYYNETGNLGSCSMPFILFDQYGSVPPQGQNLAYVGHAAGGSDCVVTWQHGVSTEGKEKLAKPMNKYVLFLRAGLRILKDKILCQKKRTNIIEKKAKAQ